LRLFVSSPGLEVSLDRLLGHSVVQREVGHQLLQVQVLLLEFFQAPELVGLHASVEALPAVVGLLGDSDLLADPADAAAGGQGRFGVAQVPDDPFGCVFLPLRHGSGPSSAPWAGSGLSFYVVRVAGAFRIYLIELSIYYSFHSLLVHFPVPFPDNI